jgi:hypothetical protein
MDWGDEFGELPKPEKPKKKSKSQDIYDLAAARAARDAGMERVMEGEDEFKIQYAMYVIKLPHGWQGTAEEIRRTWTGIRPHHVNCWGACCNAAIKQGMLVKVPFAMQRPEAVKSHGRPIHVLRKP